MDNRDIKFAVSIADDHGYDVRIGTFNPIWVEDFEELEEFFANLARTKDQSSCFEYILEALRNGMEDADNFITQ